MDIQQEKLLLARLLTCLTDADTAARGANALLPRFGNLSALLESLRPEDAGETIASILRMVPPLSRYRALERLGERPLLNTRARAAEYVAGLYIGAHYERSIMLCLDEEYRLLCCKTLTDGALKEVPFDRRHLLQTALSCHARAVILCHNHPSGNVYFSDADVATTRSAILLLTAVGIAVPDHLLVAHDRIKSMREFLYIPEKIWMNAGCRSIPQGEWLNRKPGP